MRKSRLNKSRQDRLMEHFVASTTAGCAAGLVDVNFKTAVFYYHRLRMLICLATENESDFAGEIEVDESYFGGHRKGKPGRLAAGKVPVSAFANGAARDKQRTYADTKAKTLMSIMQKK
jgi:transposase